MKKAQLMNYQYKKKNKGGFTLIELLVVLAILGLLAAMVTPQVMKHLGHAKAQTAKVEIKNLGVALDLYHLDVGSYPTQEQGLKALTEKPAGIDSWNGPYLDKKANLNDPWEQPYIYKCPGQHGEYDLMALGADKREGGTGENEDITSW